MVVKSFRKQWCSLEKEGSTTFMPRRDAYICHAGTVNNGSCTLPEPSTVSMDYCQHGEHVIYHLSFV